MVENSQEETTNNATTSYGQDWELRGARLKHKQMREASCGNHIATGRGSKGETVILAKWMPDDIQGSNGNKDKQFPLRRSLLALCKCHP